MSANDIQIDGDHYRRYPGEQHWDRMVRLTGGIANCWAYFAFTATAYIERYRFKNGVQDLKKARHFIDKLIELEEAKATEAATAVVAAEATKATEATEATEVTKATEAAKEEPQPVRYSQRELCPACGCTLLIGEVCSCWSAQEPSPAESTTGSSN